MLPGHAGLLRDRQDAYLAVLPPAGEGVHQLSPVVSGPNDHCILLMAGTSPTKAWRETMFMVSWPIW